MRWATVALLCAGFITGSLLAEEAPLPGLKQPVEILRDRWGVPHIYARNADDLFFAQGYMAARDRLWQIDLWRRVGTGKLAEILGPEAIPRDQLARVVRYRGDWNAEWASYGPGAKQAATSFTKGINAYIRSLGGKRPLEFRIAGFDPGEWEPEDCVARMAGLLMTRNVLREVSRVEDVRRFGLAKVSRLMPPEPFVPLQIPQGLDLAGVTAALLDVYRDAVGPVHFPEQQGSNSWVVDGTKSVTGKPILASDPHRTQQIPSLRRTVHLVAPCLNVIGAGEPALPGIALGHNEKIAWGFTIAGIDQQDLYVERTAPDDPERYLYRGKWRRMQTERTSLTVKGNPRPVTVELRYTVHGPVIHEDRQRHRAYALRWVGSEPGTAGYLAGLAVAQAGTWNEFLNAAARWKLPSQNLIYADIAGNIGWQVTGMTPIRNQKDWSGLFPVPGHTGRYEWSGFQSLSALPHRLNPSRHFIATANHNVLPPGYTTPIGFEWSVPFRYQRIASVLSGGRKFSIEDFQRLQQDVVSVPARRFQAVLRRWKNPPAEAGKLVRRVLDWDASLTADSVPAAIYEVWMAKLPKAVFGPELSQKVDISMLLKTLETRPDRDALLRALNEAVDELTRRLGADRSNWRWGRLHQVTFRHPLNSKLLDRGPLERPGDAYTVNAAGGSDFRQVTGASYRQIIDLSNWDRSVMTNAPGEVGDPESPHYSDLMKDWNAGRYHAMPFSRKAVEAVTIERITLTPGE